MVWIDPVERRWLKCKLLITDRHKVMVVDQTAFGQLSSKKGKASFNNKHWLQFVIKQICNNLPCHMTGKDHY